MFVEIVYNLDSVAAMQKCFQFCFNGHHICRSCSHFDSVDVMFAESVYYYVSVSVEIVDV